MRTLNHLSVLKFSNGQVIVKVVPNKMLLSISASSGLNVGFSTKILILRQKYTKILK